MNYNEAFTVRVLVAKFGGMILSVAAGLPLGKEGPMVHAGAILGCLISQGYTMSLGYDTSWQRFQDLRCDVNKRDFVTYGAAAGISGAFRAPLGGIMLVLEEAASFWSTTVTLQAFICGVICQLTLSMIFADKATSSSEMFAFGEFPNIIPGRTNYHMYEVPLFFLVGVGGGIFGAAFNKINEVMTIYRKKHLNMHIWKRMIELVLIVLGCSIIGFIFSICWSGCTPLPVITDSMTPQQISLVGSLVQFQCPDGYYNQMASLYMVTGDMATRQLVSV